MNTVFLSTCLGPSSTTTINSPPAQAGSSQKETVQHLRGRRVCWAGGWWGAQSRWCWHNQLERVPGRAVWEEVSREPTETQQQVFTLRTSPSRRWHWWQRVRDSEVYEGRWSFSERRPRAGRWAQEAMVQQGQLQTWQEVKDVQPSCLGAPVHRAHKGSGR